MAFITDKTQVNELSQIQIPKCYENYVNKAIASSTYLLTMKEFIDITGFEVNAETFDILFMNINDEGIPIYIDDNMLNWMGYESINKKEKLRDCKNLLKNNFKVNDDYKILKNKEYTIFLKDESEKIKGEYILTFNSTFPKPSIGTSARSKTHLIVMPDAFRSLCMMIATDKGKQIKKYYITLEKLIKSYNLYQVIFRSRESERAMICKDDKIDNLLLTLQQNEKKAEDRYKESQRKAEERFNKLLDIAEDAKIEAQDAKSEVIEKMEEIIEINTDLSNVINDRVSIKRVSTNRYNYIVILKDHTRQIPYYVLRIQEKSINTRISSINKTYPNTLEIFRIYNPNASMSWLSICDKYKENIRTTKTNWFSLNNITEEQFKNKIIEMDDTERKNPKFV